VIGSGEGEMNLPNILTLIRVLLIPVFVIMIINQSYKYALAVFAVAGITDGIDGLIARMTHQRTELGSYLDPIADKLLLISAYITLAIIQIIPSWLSVIVITRDVIILFVSKVTTDFQIVTVLLALMKHFSNAFLDLFTIAIYGTTIFTILSGAHYIYIGTRYLNQKNSSFAL